MAEMQATDSTVARGGELVTAPDAAAATAAPNGRAMADQVMAFAIGLAMQNAVAQQQQAYILRNAVTTAAARAILQASPEQALRFAREVLSSDDVASTLERLKKLMDDDATPGEVSNAHG